MTRLIDVDLYKEDMTKEFPEYYEEVLDAQPTVDAVPVIRCKDCDWFDCAESWCTFHEIEIHNEESGFCCWAEKKVEQ